MAFCYEHRRKFSADEGCELCREDKEMTGTVADETAYCDGCGQHLDECVCLDPAAVMAATPAEELHRADCDCVISLSRACDCDELDRLSGRYERHSERAKPFVQKDSTVVFEAPAGLFPRHPDCKNHKFTEEPGCAWCQNQFELDGMRDMRSTREKVLQRGLDLTTGDRNKTYGPPEPNLTLQMELWTLYKAAAGDKHSMAHDAAMQHVFAKLARIASGPPLHEDNYVDLSTYSAIAYECDVEVLGVES